MAISRSWCAPRWIGPCRLESSPHERCDPRAPFVEPLNSSTTPSATLGVGATLTSTISVSPVVSTPAPLDSNQAEILSRILAASALVLLFIFLAGIMGGGLLDFILSKKYAHVSEEILRIF